jgi:hypothetical protein
MIIELALAVVLAAGSAPAGPNPWSEVDQWQQGDALPTLLTVPFDTGECGLIPDPVLDAILRTQNMPILHAVLSSSDATPALFAAALGRLLDHQGLPAVRAMLTRQPVRRSEHVRLRDLFRQRLARINVASIDLRALPAEAGETALKSLAEHLAQGLSWQSAYRKLADQYRAPEAPGSGRSAFRTLLTYRYSGWVSEQGVDLVGQGAQPWVPTADLKAVIELGPGTHIRRTSQELFLYHVVDVVPPAEASAPGHHGLVTDPLGLHNP